jgi:hypothetical protein
MVWKSMSNTRRIILSFLEMGIWRIMKNSLDCDGKAIKGADCLRILKGNKDDTLKRLGRNKGRWWLAGESTRIVERI